MLVKNSIDRYTIKINVINDDYVIIIKFKWAAFENLVTYPSSIRDTHVQRAKDFFGY